MKDSVLIDTDIILDVFFNREPYAEHASEIFTLCETNQVNGFTTSVIISNVYYLLKKIAKHQVVIERLKQLMTIIDIVDINKATIIEALNSKFNDFEDALQNYAAENRGQITVILTRNIKDFKHSSLPVLTPELYLKSRTI